MMESTPVCGVDTRKDTTEPLEAPSRRKDMAVGITPHEHKGSGTPKSAEYITDFILLRDR